MILDPTRSSAVAEIPGDASVIEYFAKSLKIVALTVIQTGRPAIPNLGYGFLLAFHSNYGSILYHFRDKATYWSKIQIFHTPCIRRPR